MKRLRRRLFNLAAGVSLAFCVAFTLLWARSQFWAYQFTWLAGDRWRYAGSFRGQVYFASYRALEIHPQYLVGDHAALRFDSDPSEAGDRMPILDLKQTWPGDASFAWCGFLVAVRYYDDHTLFGYSLAIPTWVAALVFVLLPLLHVARWRQNTSRHRRGLCLKCGYDLRATPDRCPECGTIVAERMKAEG